MKKKVQVGRSRMLEELARPTWEAAYASSKEKPKERRAETRQKVERINVPAPVTRRKLRVAAYARVSTDLDSQETSIENQCDHYKSLIEANPAWELAGIYAESGVSGTKADTRAELQRLMQDCEAGAGEIFYAGWIQSNDSFWICTPLCIPLHPLRTIVNRIA